jgi:hypothetical protein
MSASYAGFSDSNIARTEDGCKQLAIEFGDANQKTTTMGTDCHGLQLEWMD